MTMLNKHFAILCCAITLAASANANPYFAISALQGAIDNDSQQTLMLLPPVFNTYVNNTDTHPAGLGITLGKQFMLSNNWQARLGVSYYQLESMAVQGNIWQFDSPQFNDLDYTYWLKNQRLLIEATLLAPAWCNLQPLLTVGAGMARNQSYAYQEIPRNEIVLPMTEPFAAHSKNSFSYVVGVGVAINLTPQLDCNLIYRFADLGKSALGTSSVQTTSDHLQLNYLSNNEFIAQLSYQL